MTEDAIRFTPTRRLALGGAVLLAIGAIGGGVVGRAMQRPIEMAPIRPVAIRSLPATDGIVTVRGKVAAIYGNKFLIDDGSARALVDTGRAGEGGTMVAQGAPLTVQGRYDDGSFRASFLVDAAGTVTALRPLEGRGGRHGPGGRHEHGPRRGPEDRGPSPSPTDGPDDAPPPASQPAR